MATIAEIPHAVWNWLLKLDWTGLIKIVHVGDTLSIVPGPWLFIILATLIILFQRTIFLRRGQWRITLVKIKIPFIDGEMTVEADSKERQVAWEIFAELASRVTMQPLVDKGGILRETLTSLYNFFKITRDIIKTVPPEYIKNPYRIKRAGRRKRPGDRKEYTSVAEIGLALLNGKLRTFLAEWHPILEQYEAKRPVDASKKTYEDAWSENEAFRTALKDLQLELSAYAYQLGRIAEVEPKLLKKLTTMSQGNNGEKENKNVNG